MRSLANILTIFELAVNNLSKRNATLIDLEKIIKFTTTKLTAIGTPLAKTFLDAFEKRMLERRNAKLIHVIKYLENPSFIKEKKDQCGEKIVRKDIETMILQLWQRLFPKKNVEVPSEADQNIPNDISDNFDNLADEFKNFDDNQYDEVEVSELSAIQKEMRCFEADPKNRPIRFQVVFAALLSIKPTSTEPERAFSIMGYFCTKIRNRLSDEALDAMVFMRQYLKNQREKKRLSQNSQKNES